MSDLINSYERQIRDLRERVNGLALKLSNKTREAKLLRGHLKKAKKSLRTAEDICHGIIYLGVNLKSHKHENFKIGYGVLLENVRPAVDEFKGLVKDFERLEEAAREDQK